MMISLNSNCPFFSLNYNFNLTKKIEFATASLQSFTRACNCNNYILYKHARFFRRREVCTIFLLLNHYFIFVFSFNLNFESRLDFFFGKNRIDVFISPRFECVIVDIFTMLMLRSFGLCLIKCVTYHSGWRPRGIVTHFIRQSPKDRSINIVKMSTMRHLNLGETKVTLVFSQLSSLDLTRFFWINFTYQHSRLRKKNS